MASVSSSALFTERRRRRPSEADSIDGSSSSQAAAAAAGVGSLRGTPSSSQTSFPSWSQGGAPRGPRGAPHEGVGASQGPPPEFPPTPSPAFPFGSPMALPPIPERDTSRCLLLASQLPAVCPFPAAVAAAAAAAFGVYRQVMSLLCELVQRARLSLAGVGGGIAADAELIESLENLLDVCCCCCCC